MNDKKIIFMGTPEISTHYLNALLYSGFNILSVFSQPPKKQSRGMNLIESPIHKLSIQKKINILTPDKFDIKTVSILKELKPDLIVVMAYGNILPKSVLQIPKYGCINVHVSALPRWRGAAPIEHALFNGDKETGVTIIKLLEKLDAGPIISQKKFKIPDNFNKLQLSNHLTKLGCELLIDTTKNIFNEKISLIPQDESKVTYANKIKAEDRKINFNNTASNIINLIRAHSPKPGAWFTYKNERIKILDAKKLTNLSKPSIINNSNFEIGCLDASIKLLTVQREGKKVITIEEFLRGFKFSVGDSVNE